MLQRRSKLPRPPARAAVPFAPSRLAVTLLAPSLLAALLVAGCGGGEPEVVRGPGSALWVRPGEVERLDAGMRGTLREGGVGELFLEAGRLVGEPGAPQVEPALDALPKPLRLRLPVTLALTGDAALLAVPDDAGAAAAEALAGELGRLRRRSEERGLTPVGVHLDLAPPPSAEALERYAATLGRLRRELDPDLLLSVSLAPETLDLEPVETVAGAVDFLVPVLYGVRPGGGPAPAGEAAWDLGAAEERLARLAELDRPFLVGTGTLGVLARIDGRGQPVAETTVASLGELVASPALERGRTAVLAGLDRKDFLFEVARPVRLAGWSLARGERLLASRPFPHHLRDLARRAEAAAPERYLGQLYLRLPAAGEALSIDAPALAAAQADDPATPQLEVHLEPAGQGRSRLTVRLENRGVHPTDVATLGMNYVELRALGGARFEAVAPGDFQRYQLEHRGERVSHMRALSAADGVKLFAPLVEPGDVLESGPVVLDGVRGDGPRVEVRGQFMLPSGDVVELPAREWPAPDAGGETP